MPAPTVVRTTDGSVLAEVEGRQFRVLSWVDVRPADVTLDVARVGRLVAALHQLGAPGEGEGAVDPWYTQPVGPDGWDDLVIRLASAGSPLAADVAGLRDELCRNEELLEPPRALRPLHLDLWADNVRATPTGDLCVLDWDNSGLGDPRQELAVVLFEFTSWSPARTRGLYSAYVDAVGPARITRAEDFSMAVAQLGHILQWQCQNWLSAGTPAGRQHAEAAVREYVERPLTRTVVDRMVDTLT
jgi:Ser/Thr protein kinase RdoA (MazF antagonist)